LNDEPGWRWAWAAKLNWLSSEYRWVEASATILPFEGLTEASADAGPPPE
jgi:hypothetical protein